MAVQAQPLRSTDPRRSIESLRAGVPNRDAVRDLGTHQQEVETRFLTALSEIPAARKDDKQLTGFFIQGGFGSGKSHLLEWLQHLALDQGFAVSKIVVSKEAPLSDSHKLFRGAIDGLRLPDRRGIAGLHEVAGQLDFRTEGYRQFVHGTAERYDPLFAATLYLFENLRAGDQEFVDRLVSFWAGDPLGIADLRRALRQLGSPHIEIKMRKKADLAIPRFQFVSDLLAATGAYQGWIILLDEVELVATFSLLARARSYSMLARLMGLIPESTMPGIFAVGCATDDFTGAVFQQRGDHETIAQRLGAYPNLVEGAEAGMSFLWPEKAERWMRLRRLDADGIRAMRARIGDLYGAAHGGVPADITDGPYGYERSLRQFVREWITRWDLQRLYPQYQPDIETVDLRPLLEERPDLEQPSEEEDPDNALS